MKLMLAEEIAHGIINTLIYSSKKYIVDCYSNSMGGVNTENI